MPLIDAHVHLYPPEINSDPAGWAARHGEGHWAELSLRIRKNGRPVQTFPGIDDLLRAMDAAGVGRAVLLGWYWNQPASCVLQNRFYAGCVRRHPDRLAAFATLQPSGGREGTLAEMQRALDDGLVGIGELSPHAQGYPVDDPAFRAVLALAGERRVPVNLHVTDPDSRDFPGKVATPPEDFVRLARECPQTTFILSHWGGLLPLRDRGAGELANLLYDSSASPLLYDAGIWRRFVSAVGAEKVVFGSDFPLNLYPKLDAEPGIARLVAEARGAAFAPAEFAAIMGGNAAGWR